MQYAWFSEFERTTINLSETLRIGILFGNFRIEKWSMDRRTEVGGHDEWRVCLCLSGRANEFEKRAWLAQSWDGCYDGILRAQRWRRLGPPFGKMQRSGKVPRLSDELKVRHNSRWCFGWERNQSIMQTSRTSDMAFLSESHAPSFSPNEQPWQKALSRLCPFSWWEQNITTYRPYQAIIDTFCPTHGNECLISPKAARVVLNGKPTLPVVASDNVRR